MKTGEDVIVLFAPFHSSVSGNDPFCDVTEGKALHGRFALMSGRLTHGG